MFLQRMISAVPDSEKRFDKRTFSGNFSTSSYFFERVDNNYQEDLEGAKYFIF